MAKIYTLYVHQDAEKFAPIILGLRNFGHEIIISKGFMLGSTIQSGTLRTLKEADGAIVFVTQESLGSTNFKKELVTIKGFIESRSSKQFLIPIIDSVSESPGILRDWTSISFDENNSVEILKSINDSVLEFSGQKEAVEETEILKRQEIEKKASDHIDPILETLRKRESRNNQIANFWYSIGFFALIFGIIYTIDGLKALNTINQANYIVFILLILKSIVIVGLLVACSKYAFNLGKTYMNEALRNADRGHAISFGKFYLQSFSDRANTYEEIKEMFQNWNIDKESAFQKLDTDSFDPKFTDKLLEITKNLSEKLPKLGK